MILKIDYEGSSVLEYNHGIVNPLCWCLKPNEAVLFLIVPRTLKNQNACLS